MFWTIFIGLLLAGNWAEAYLRRRRNGRPAGDWTFLRSRRALWIGGATAILLISPGVGGSKRDLLFAVPSALLIGALVAMAMSRYSRWARHSVELPPD